jgi:hypothetical protein
MQPKRRMPRDAVELLVRMNKRRPARIDGAATTQWTRFRTVSRPAGKRGRRPPRPRSLRGRSTVAVGHEPPEREVDGLALVLSPYSRITRSISSSSTTTFVRPTGQDASRYT